MEDTTTGPNDEDHVEVALEQYRNGETGIRGAVDVAGLSIGEMMAEANERGILQNYDEADLESDVESLL